MEQQKSPKPKIGNAELADKLAAFDYTQLKGKSFEDYLNLTIGALANPANKLESDKNKRSGGLAHNNLYDYEGYRCAAIKDELYPGMKDTPIVVTGLLLKDVKPEITTRITAGRAKLLNEQVGNFDMRVPGLYFLIKKVDVAKTETQTSQPAKNK